MTTRSDWKHALDARGIKVWVCEKVAHRASGVIVDHEISRVIEYRDESFRLFLAGNVEAAIGYGHAMQDAAVRLDCDIEEKTAIQAGRKLQQKAIEGNAEKKAEAVSRYAGWQARASEIWKQPQHANKSASAVAMLISPEQFNTVRKHITKP